MLNASVVPITTKGPIQNYNINSQRPTSVLSNSPCSSKTSYFYGRRLQQISVSLSLLIFTLCLNLSLITCHQPIRHRTYRSSNFITKSKRQVSQQSLISTKFYRLNLPSFPTCLSCQLFRSSSHYGLSYTIHEGQNLRRGNCKYFQQDCRHHHQDYQDHRKRYIQKASRVVALMGRKVWDVGGRQGDLPTIAPLFSNIFKIIHSCCNYHHVRIMRLHQGTTSRSLHTKRQRGPSTNPITKPLTRPPHQDPQTYRAISQAILRTHPKWNNRQGRHRPHSSTNQRINSYLLPKPLKGKILRPSNHKRYRPTRHNERRHQGLRQLSL